MARNTTPREADEQAAVIRWRDMMVSSGQEPRLRLLHGDASGVRVSMGAAVKMRRQGAVKGWPDIFLAVPDVDWDGDFEVRTEYGLFIELKRRCGGVVSPEQHEIHALLREQGYLVEVCRGADEAIVVIKGYLGIP